MGWIGVDLDGTLAEYGKWTNGHIGAPIKPMQNRVLDWLNAGKDVRIMTARVGMGAGYSAEFVQEQRMLIEAWCLEHLGRIIPITASKDFAMIELWDDRAIQIVPNTGRRADGLE